MLSVRPSVLPHFSKSSKTKQIENNVRYWRDCGSGQVDHWWHPSCSTYFHFIPELSNCMRKNVSITAFASLHCLLCKTLSWIIAILASFNEDLQRIKNTWTLISLWEKLRCHNKVLLIRMQYLCNGTKNSYVYVYRMFSAGVLVDFFDLWSTYMN